MRGHEANRRLSHREIEAHARAVRLCVAPDLALTEALPGIQMFERLSCFGVKMTDGSEIDLDYAVNELPPGVEALALYDDEEKKIVIATSPDTYTALEQGRPGARMCLWHEVGHAVLHTSELIRLGRIAHPGQALARQHGSRHPAAMDTEWQAESFAAAVQMPAAGLSELAQRPGGLTVGVVIEAFHVLESAARTRIAIYLDSRSGFV